MRDLLLQPTFARLDDYFGVWAMEPDWFLKMWQAIDFADFAPRLWAAAPPRPSTTVEMAPVKGGKTIAVVKAQSTLMKGQSIFGGTSTVQLRRDIRSAAADPNVSGILLHIDSPGGTIAGTADLAADIKSVRRKKPVWAHIDDLGASAAYWMASQADAIYANAPTALVGSIGSLLTVYDLSAAAERDGVKTLVFRTGPLKGVGVPGAPVTDEQASHLQQIVNDAQSHFDTAVRTGRGMTMSQLTAVRTGGVFPAAEAVERRLIDGIRPFEATLDALAAAR